MDNNYSFGQRVLLMVAQILGPAFLWLIGFTWRVKYEGVENYENAIKLKNKVLFCFWHSRLLGLCYTHRYQDIGIMVSKSFDGEWITRIVTQVGYRTFRGSSSRNGAVAFIEMLKNQDKGDLALTVDGPRGPAQKAKPGAILLAANSGLPLVPISYIADKAWRLKSWDKFIVPKPFSTLTVRYGKHIVVPESPSQSDIDDFTLKIGEAIDQLG